MKHTYSSVSGFGTIRVIPSASVKGTLLLSFKDCSHPAPVAAFSKSKEQVSVIGRLTQPRMCETTKLGGSLRSSFRSTLEYVVRMILAAGFRVRTKFSMLPICA